MSKLKTCQNVLFSLDNNKARRVSQGFPPWPFVPAPRSSPLPSASLRADPVRVSNAVAEDCDMSSRRESD